MIVSFDVPNAVATELNAIAVKAGFPNAKAMNIAYLLATLLSARQAALASTIPAATVSDVIIS